jgi:hypothetical protein
VSGIGDSLDNLLRNPEAKPSVAAFTTPRGWEPRVEQDETGGTGVTTARPAAAQSPSHVEILREFGLDAEEWRVTSLRKSRWQVASSEEAGARWLEAFRATFVPVQPNDPAILKADLDELFQVVEGWKPGKTAIPTGRGVPASFLVAISDFQLGKGENGGSRTTVDRVLHSFDRSVARIAELRAAGRRIDQVEVVGLGDIVEQCSGYYGMQTFQADLDMRQQRRLAWRLALRGVLALAPLVPQLRITGIGGNHGESTRNEAGKATTTFSDNDDLLMLDALHDIIAAHAGLQNVRVEMPADPLAHMIETSGALVGMVHGHQFRAGKSAGEKAHQWWLGQMMGLQPIKDANILLNGHFHHLSITEHSKEGRTTIQVPSMDGGSYWFTAATGSSAPAGMLTMLVGSELGPRKWDDLQIL